MRKIALLFVVSFFLLLSPHMVLAAVINVPGDMTIEDALSTAAANGEDDTISIAAGTYPITSTLVYTPDENKSLTIEGSGKTATILDGQLGTPILDIDTLSLPTDSDAHIFIRDLSFTRGKAGDASGGLVVQTNTADITLENLRFNANEGPAGGGASFYSYHGTVMVSGCQFVGNSAKFVGGGLVGSTEHGDLTLQANTFRGNVATSVGGSTKRGGGCALSTDYGALKVESNLFFNNSAGEEAGGAHIGTYYTGSSVSLMNNIFRSNSAPTGAGAIVFTGETGVAIIINNTFHDNSGGWTFLVELEGDDAGAKLYNNISWGNPDSKGDIYLYDDKDGNGVGGGVDLYYNNYSTLDVDVGDHMQQDNNVNRNPLVSPDSHLQPTSPCIDAGICGEWIPIDSFFIYLRIAPYTDFDGDSRCPDKTTTGCCDMGADEFRVEHIPETLRVLPWLFLLLDE